jgi:hypothetical protein
MVREVGDVVAAKTDLTGRYRRSDSASITGFDGCNTVAKIVGFVGHVRNGLPLMLLLLLLWMMVEIHDAVLQLLDLLPEQFALLLPLLLLLQLLLHQVRRSFNAAFLLPLLLFEKHWLGKGVWFWLLENDIGRLGDAAAIAAAQSVAIALVVVIVCMTNTDDIVHIILHNVVDNLHVR